MYKFKRPENLSFPQVYYKFKAKNKNSDEIVEYRVQDLPEEYYEQAIDFLVKYFLPDETFCSSRDIHKKTNGVKAFRRFWEKALEEKISIACFKNDQSGELVGANVLIVNSKDDLEGDTKEVCRWLDVVDRTSHEFLIIARGPRQY